MNCIFVAPFQHFKHSKCLQFVVVFTHSHSHIGDAGWKAGHQEQFGVPCLTQGHSECQLSVLKWHLYLLWHYCPPWVCVSSRALGNVLATYCSCRSTWYFRRILKAFNSDSWHFLMSFVCHQSVLRAD